MWNISYRGSTVAPTNPSGLALACDRCNAYKAKSGYGKGDHEVTSRHTSIQHRWTAAGLYGAALIWLSGAFPRNRYRSGVATSTPNIFK
jgi:hypothetical protein